MAPNIEVVNLTRGEDGDARVGSLPWVSGGNHTIWAPWPAAELEVRRRVLRTFSERTTPPEGVAFIRMWEQNADTSAQVLTERSTMPPAIDHAPSPINGICSVGNFGPAAEMAAAARDRENASPAVGNVHPAATYDNQAALAPKARKRGR